MVAVCICQKCNLIGCRFQVFLCGRKSRRKNSKYFFFEKNNKLLYYYNYTMAVLLASLTKTSACILCALIPLNIDHSSDMGFKMYTLASSYIHISHVVCKERRWLMVVTS